METTMVNNREAPSAIEPKPADPSTRPDLLFIDLSLLDDNPYQARAQRDELKSAQLRESIAIQGQLQPILVRRAGPRWQIIFGHGRVEALRRLRKEATTDADRARFSKVCAQERLDVSDEQMVLLGLIENIQREDISPLDCAEALVRLRALRPDLETADAIAQEVHLERPKVYRLLRLYGAPQVIKDGVSKGKTFVVPIAEQDTDPKSEHLVDPEEPTTEEVRKLTLNSALSLARLYQFWCKEAGEQPAAEGTPDERMGALIDRVLTEDWGIRRVRLEVSKLAHGERPPRPADARRQDASSEEVEPGSAAFIIEREKLVIFMSRLSQMNDAQKTHLRLVLQPIWNQLGGESRLEPITAAKPLDQISSRLAWREWKQVAHNCKKLWKIFLYIVGMSPAPGAQLPDSVQLPSPGDPRSLRRANSAAGPTAATTGNDRRPGAS